MTISASALTDLLLSRVNATGRLAVDPSFARALLSATQRTANAGLRRVISSSVPFATEPYRLLYNTRVALPSAVDILNVSINASGARSLLRCTISDLYAYSPTWFRDNSTRFEFFCPVARDLLIIYPSLATASTLYVTYTALTSDLTSPATPLELPDDDIDLPLGLAEVVLLLQARRVPLAKKRLEALTESVKAYGGQY